MRQSVLRRHIQITRIKNQKYLIEYKPKDKKQWCYFDYSWPNVNHTPNKVEYLLKTHQDCSVKLSQYNSTIHPKYNNFIIVKELI